MAAVIGSKDSLINRDPKRMPVRRILSTKLLLHKTDNGYINAGSSVFFTGDFFAKTSGNYAANTEVTLVNITGGSGYLTHVVGPSDQDAAAGTTTFKITVDGLETAVAFDSTGLNAFVDYDRICLGYLPVGYDTNMQVSSRYAKYYGQSLYSGAGNYRNDDDSYISQNPGYFATLPNTALLIADTPQVCVRFETSLKVTITTSYISNNAHYRFSGAVYLLDPPAS